MNFHIFNDHYEELIYITHPRHSVIDNVDRMLGCGDPSFGAAMYGCTSCGNLKFVAFRCHSRFCPSCGNMYSKLTESIEDALDVADKMAEETNERYSHEEMFAKLREAVHE